MKLIKSLFVVALLFVSIFTMLPLSTIIAQETLVWSGDVSSNGSLVTGPVLKSGRTYRIVTAGSNFWYDSINNLCADAQYYTTDNSHYYYWGNYFSAPDGHSFLQVDGKDQSWGPFSNGDTGHTYSIEYTGTGEEITFQIIDWIDNDYSNNGCHMPVKIYVCSAGLTPGFWKNHVACWEGYDTSEFFNEIFDVEITIDIGKESENSNPTLLEALYAKNGINEISGVYDALVRHAVAALLNSAHTHVDYPMTEEEIINAVHNAIISGNPNPELLKNQLDDYNNLADGIDAHGNPI